MKYLYENSPLVYAELGLAIEDERRVLCNMEE